MKIWKNLENSACNTTRKGRNPINTLDNDTGGVYGVCMKRVNYHLTEKQLEALRQESEKSGLSVAELIRRAVDAFLERRGKKA